MSVITDEYRALQQRMHETKHQYGGANVRVYGPVVLEGVELYNAQSVLDYGAGKGHFGEFLFVNGFKGDYRPYDPAVPWWSSPPQPSDFVICLDVLEHVEPECLESVLLDLRRCLIKGGLFIVHTREAKKSLPDGRNAHLTIQPPEWWAKRIGEHFVIRKQNESLGKHDLEMLAAIFSVEPLR